jgi:signal transduction histidine kinase
MRKFSFRTKLLLVYAGCALTLVFIAFLAGSYYINRLQKANVRESIALVKEHGYNLAQEILEMVVKKKATGLEDPEIKDSLDRMTAMTVQMNNAVVWMGIFDADGNKVIAQAEQDKQDFRVYPSSEGSINKVSDGKGGLLEIQTRPVLKKDLSDIPIPLTHEGKTYGHIEMRISNNPTFLRMQQTSRNITEVLITGSILMLALLLLVFLVLWKLFSRQLKLQQDNARLDRMAYVGTLASGLAHEIRNPLSAMNVNLEVMREELAESVAAPDFDGTKDRAVELAGRVQREVLQLNSTLTSFLDFALPSKEGRMEFSLRGLAEELLDLHAEEMRQRGITWDLQSVSHDDATVEADRRLVHQAVRNILMNAIQILDASVRKHIKIRIVRTQDNWVETFISDSGPGIPPDNLGRVFEVFFSTRKGGSGFGLAIAQKIAEEHGGSIKAENNPGSLGAVFTIRLPRKAISEADLAERRLRRFARSAA